MTPATTLRRIATTVAAGAALACVAAAAPADAAVPHHGKVYVVIGGTADQKAETVIMHGALNAIGTDPETNSDAYDVLKFPHGSFRVNHPAKHAKFTQHVNSKTCFASFTEKGTFTLARGKGVYAGIHGSGSYSGSGTFFLTRTKSGACDDNAQPRAGLFVVHAHGTLK